MSVYGSIGLVTTSEKEHISFMNFIESVFGVGIVLSYFLFPLFVDKEHPGSASWRNVYFLLGGISLLAFLLLLTSKLNESAAKFEKQENIFDDLGKLISFIAKPAVGVFIICAFLYVLLEQSIMSWLPTFNNDVLKLNEVLSIRMASILAGSMALGRFLTGIGLKKLNWVVALTVCLTVAALIVFCSMPFIKQFVASYKGNGITTLADVPLIAFVFPLIGLVIAPIYPTLNSVILSSLPKPAHGLMSGLIIIFSAIGGTTGSIITGNIFFRIINLSRIGF
jgi:fucose permease